jgi:hypothetical protein
LGGTEVCPTSVLVVRDGVFPEEAVEDAAARVTLTLLRVGEGEGVLAPL